MVSSSTAARVSVGRLLHLRSLFPLGGEATGGGNKWSVKGGLFSVLGDNTYGGKATTAWSTGDVYLVGVRGGALHPSVGVKRAFVRRYELCASRRCDYDVPERVLASKPVFQSGFSLWLRIKKMQAGGLGTTRKH